MGLLTVLPWLRQSLQPTLELPDKSPDTCRLELLRRRPGPITIGCR